MALSLTWRIVVCLPVVVLITGLSDFHLRSSFFNYGPEVQKGNRNCHKKIPSEGISIINKGMQMMYGIDLSDGFYTAVEKFYKEMVRDADPAFKTITKHLGKLFATSEFIFKGKLKFNSYNTEEQTQALLIYLYTTKTSNEKESIYYTLNKILRDHSERCDYKVRDNDEHIAPYAAALTATLIHWDRLIEADSITYRGIMWTISEPNDPIIWYSFTSSSTSKTQAANYGTVTTYTIHNRGIDKKWQPKLISDFSAEKAEKEALYPPGSVFLFNNVVHIGTKIAYDISLQNIQLDEEKTQCGR